MSIVFFTHQGESAQENMDYDRHLSLNYRDGLLFRHYRWQTSGVTIPENRESPPVLQTYDIGIRPTGGGILFHSSGDFLFSLVASAHDSRFPKPLSQKMAWVSALMRESLEACGVLVQPDRSDIVVERQYCHTYPNPFELRYHGDKVCAFAVRRFRRCFLLQGLLHLRDNRRDFSGLGETYWPYFSRGLGLSEAAERRLIAVFLEKVAAG